MVTSMPVTITPQRLAQLQSNIDRNMEYLRIALTVWTPEEAALDRPVIEQATLEAEDYYRVIYGLGKGNFSPEFWKTEEGELLARAWMFLKGNDLIELSLAASILIDGAKDSSLEQARLDYNQNARRVFMNSLIRGSSPRLKVYHELDARYPMRVSREEVIKLSEERKQR